MRISGLLMGLLLILSGCGRVPFKAPDPWPVSPQWTAEQLAAEVWTNHSGKFQLRQTVLFEYRGARIPMTGLMRLDLTEGRLRLVALNDLGVKLFDLEVDQASQQQHYLLPDLAQIPHLAEAVSASVRRLFLTPRPDGRESLTLTARRAELRRPFASGEVTFVFGGRGTHLLETEVTADQEKWRARYYEYREIAESHYPRGIVLDDRKAGYRLTLWQEEVRKIHE